MITFEAGYTPKGLFGFMTADLLGKKPEDENELAIALDEDSIFRDELTVSVGPYLDKFRLSVRPAYVRIDVFPSSLDRVDSSR